MECLNTGREVAEHVVLIAARESQHFVAALAEPLAPNAALRKAMAAATRRGFECRSSSRS